MEKPWFESKTIIGAGLFALISFLLAADLIPKNSYIEFLRWLSAGFGFYGLRDAID